MSDDKNSVPDWLLPNKAYDVLKWIGLIVCPALAALCVGIGQIIGITEMSNVGGIIALISTFIGAIIGVSAAGAKGGDTNGKQAGD